MPKKTRKMRREDEARKSNSSTSDREDDELGSVLSVEGSVEGSVDDPENTVDSQNDFEIKFLQNLDGVQEKGSAQHRLECLLHIRKALSSVYTPEFITSRKVSILDMLSKILTRGNDADRAAASAIASLLCLQLGVSDAEDIFAEVKGPLTAIIEDPAVNFGARAECCQSLGVCCFLGSTSLDDSNACLELLKKVFMSKLPRETLQQRLHCKSLMAWGLVLTGISLDNSDSLLSMSDVLFKMLENGGLDLRIVAGEVTALVYETLRDASCRLPPNRFHVMELLKELATVSGRNVGKKEKKKQRCSFRDILKAAEDGSVPDELIHVEGEGLQLDSWSKRHQYTVLKDLIGSGLNIHLRVNFLVRDILGMGLPLARIPLTRDQRRAQVLCNTIASRDRHISRHSTRDQKYAFLS